MPLLAKQYALCLVVEYILYIVPPDSYQTEWAILASYMVSAILASIHQAVHP